MKRALIALVTAVLASVAWAEVVVYPVQFLSVSTPPHLAFTVLIHGEPFSFNCDQETWTRIGKNIGKDGAIGNDGSNDDPFPTCPGAPGESVQINNEK